MRKVLFFSIVAIIIASSGTHAQERKMSPELKQISTQLGIPAEKAAELVAELEKQSGVSATYRALDMVEKAVSTVSTQMEKTAPEIWRIMIKQQYTDALIGIITPLIFLATLLVIKRWSDKWTFKDWKDRATIEAENVSEIISRESACVARSVIQFALLTLLSVISIMTISTLLPHLINPEYYAIQDMFQIVVRMK